MIIFGWGHERVKQIGPLSEKQCKNCNNQTNREMLKISTWFTLFFIPVFPYSIKYFKACPVCNVAELLEKEISKHKQKLNNSNIDTSKIKGDPVKYREGLMNKWKKEIQGFENQVRQINKLL